MSTSLAGSPSASAGAGAHNPANSTHVAIAIAPFSARFLTEGAAHEQDRDDNRDRAGGECDHGGKQLEPNARGFHDATSSV